MSARLERWRGLLADARAYMGVSPREDLGVRVQAMLPEELELMPEDYPLLEDAARACIERYVGAWVPAYSAVVGDVFVALRELCMDALDGTFDPEHELELEPERVLPWLLERFDGLLHRRIDTLYMLLLELDARLEVLEAHPPRGRLALADALHEFMPSLLEFTSLTTHDEVADHLAEHLALWLEVASERALGEGELDQLTRLARAHFGDEPLVVGRCGDYIDAAIGLCLRLSFGAPARG